MFRQELKVAGQHLEHPRVTGGFVILNQGLQRHRDGPMVPRYREDAIRLACCQQPLQERFGFRLECIVIEAVGQRNEPVQVVWPALRVILRRIAAAPRGIADGIPALIQVPGQAVGLCPHLILQPTAGSDGAKRQTAKGRRLQGKAGGAARRLANAAPRDGRLGLVGVVRICCRWPALRRHRADRQHRRQENHA